MSCEGGTVKFKVKNTGARGGAEVVQLYICPPGCGIAMPEKKLAAFKKLYLEAGEERTVELAPDIFALRAFDESADKFVVFGGQYGVKIGSSSRDIRLEGSMFIDGVRPAGSVAAEREDIIAAAKAAHMQQAATGGRRERVEITMHSPLIDLKRARGALGRLIYKIADFYCTSKKQTALLTFRYITVRSAMQYAGFNLARAHGFVDVCNGNFLKGLKKLITGKEKI